MTWQAIANFSSTLDKALKDTIALKESRDAAAEIPNIWSDFVIQSSNFLDDAQNHLNVTQDNYGSMNCLTAFPQEHEEFKENNKPFSSYVLNKLDNHANNILKKLKNPITQNAIQSRIDGYKVNLAQNLASTEAKLIHDKRYSDSIDGIEKTSRSTYIAPHLLEENLATVVESINHLSLTPSDRERLHKTATDEIAYSAALGTLHNSPELVHSTNINDSWKKYLSVPQIEKFENQAAHILENKKALMQTHVKNTFKSHIASIKDTGRGMIGILDLARNTFGQDSDLYREMQSSEKLAYDEHKGMLELKLIPLAQGLEILNQYHPHGDDPEYPAKQKIYEVLKKNLDNQYTQALKDPARYVENLFSDELAGITAYEERLNTRKKYQEQKGLKDTKYMTLDERNFTLAKINNDDPNIVKKEIDTIMKIGGNIPSNKLGLEILEEVLKDDRQKLRIPTLFYARHYMLKQDLADDFSRIIAKRKELFSQQSTSDLNKLKAEIENNRMFQSWKRKTLTQDGDHQDIEVQNMHEAIRHLARLNQVENYDFSNKKAVNIAVDKLIKDNYIDFNTGFSIYTPLSLSHLTLPKQIIHEGRVHEVNGKHLYEKLLETRKSIIEKERIAARSAQDKDTETLEGRAEKLQRLENGYFVLSKDGKTIKYSYVRDNKRKFTKDYETGQIIEINLID